jgi:hypothetical protein
VALARGLSQSSNQDGSPSIFKLTCKFFIQDVDETVQYLDCGGGHVNMSDKNLRITHTCMHTHRRTSEAGNVNKMSGLYQSQPLGCDILLQCCTILC